MATPNTPVTIPDAELHILSSSIVKQDFSIFAALPNIYHEDDQAYPVVYVLDGNFAFGVVTDIVRLFDFFKELREVIIVGIGYPGVSTLRSSMGFRTRDYTPTDNNWFLTNWPNGPQYVGEGEAGNFLQFIREELMPFINNNYRTLPEDNALVGFSFGGLFGVYTLFTQPETFKRYLIGSPSLWWDDWNIHNLEKDYAEQHSDLPAWVFMSVGGDEPSFMIADMYRMAHKLQGRNYKSLELSTHFFEGEGHMSAVPAFISRGLKAAFVKKRLTA